MEQVDASIARYLAALDRADCEEGDMAETKANRLKSRRRSQLCEARCNSSKGWSAKSRTLPTNRCLVNRPDARSMTTSGEGTGIVGYNVQTAVDVENHLIVAHEVTNVGTQLMPMALKAQTD